MIRALCLLTIAFAAWAEEVDVGLRMHDGTKTEKLAADDKPSASPMKFKKDGATYGVMLVNPNDPDATKGRVRLASGETKALKRYNPAKWYQAPYNADMSCSDFCASLGKASRPSPEGSVCTSGETRRKSAVEQGIQFVHGCWGGCCAGSGCAAFRANTMTLCTKCDNGPCGTLPKTYWACWFQGQKKDCDATDAVVGCYCG